jgi:hypothetical protein
MTTRKVEASEGTEDVRVSVVIMAVSLRRESPLEHPLPVGVVSSERTVARPDEEPLMNKRSAFQHVVEGR